MPSEVDTVFRIIETTEGKASVKALMELCDYIEKQVIHEDQRISLRENLDDMNLEDVSSRHNSQLQVSLGQNNSATPSVLEAQNETLGDAKLLLIEGIELASQFKARVDRIRKAGKPKDIEKLKKYIDEFVQKTHQSCTIIERIDVQQKVDRRKRDQSSHRINQLELELRKQSEVVNSLYLDSNTIHSLIDSPDTRKDLVGVNTSPFMPQSDNNIQTESPLEQEALKRHGNLTLNLKKQESFNSETVRSKQTPTNMKLSLFRQNTFGDRDPSEKGPLSEKSTSRSFSFNKLAT